MIDRDEKNDGAVIAAMNLTVRSRMRQDGDF